MLWKQRGSAKVEKQNQWLTVGLFYHKNVVEQLKESVRKEKQFEIYINLDDCLS